MNLNKSHLNDQTSRQIERIQDDAINATPETIQQTTMQNVGASAPSVMAPDNFDQGLAFSNQTLSDAISRKAGARYGQKMNELSVKSNYDSIERKFKKLSVAGELVAQEHAHNERARALYKAKIQARRAARGQMLGSVLGIVGAVVGGIYGGPGGAAAGGAIGQGLGQSAAG